MTLKVIYLLLNNNNNNNNNKLKCYIESLFVEEYYDQVRKYNDDEEILMEFNIDDNKN